MLKGTTNLLKPSQLDENGKIDDFAEADMIEALNIDNELLREIKRLEREENSLFWKVIGMITRAPKKLKRQTQPVKTTPRYVSPKQIRAIRGE